MNEEALVSRLEQELAEIQEVVSQTSKFIEKIHQTDDQDYFEAIVSALALNLHSFYTGAERAFVEIARKIDVSLPEGPQWHQQLLVQMVSEIPGVRLPVISAQTQHEMDEFRRFRHVVRSNYAYKLDSDQVLKLAAKLPQCSQLLNRDCQGFARALGHFSPQADPNPGKARQLGT